MAAHEMNPGQTITACGRLRSITVRMRRFGSPRFNIRAKVYLTAPEGWETGFPLPNYVGQSTNVIAASSVAVPHTNYTFLFDDIEVSGKWTVVFEFESVVVHTEYDYIIWAIGMQAPEGALYPGGDFAYYIADSDLWYLYTIGDMVFTCTYCLGECTTTTTPDGRF